MSMRWVAACQSSTCGSFYMCGLRCRYRLLRYSAVNRSNVSHSHTHEVAALRLCGLLELASAPEYRPAPKMYGGRGGGVVGVMV